MTPSEDWGRSSSVKGSLLGQLHVKPPLGHRQLGMGTWNSCSRTPVPTPSGFPQEGGAWWTEA